MTATDHDRPDDTTPDQDKDTETEQVSDTGGDSDPAASTADSAPTGEAQASRNREDESPS